MAEEIGLSGQSATADVTVNIVDDNDNVPKFNQDHYDVTIPENVLPGTVVVQVSYPFAFRYFCLLGSLVTSVLLPSNSTQDWAVVVVRWLAGMAHDHEVLGSIPDISPNFFKKNLKS